MYFFNRRNGRREMQNCILASEFWKYFPTLKNGFKTDFVDLLFIAKYLYYISYVF
jgi:hypothetical protein